MPVKKNIFSRNALGWYFLANALGIPKKDHSLCNLGTCFCNKYDQSSEVIKFLKTEPNSSSSSLAIDRVTFNINIFMGVDRKFVFHSFIHQKKCDAQAYYRYYVDSPPNTYPWINVIRYNGENAYDIFFNLIFELR